MTKEEFIRELQHIRGDATITAEDYAILEYVYTWHPAIADVGGKHQIAEIFVHGGMLVIRDMFPRAQRAEQVDGQVRAIRKDIAGMEKKVSDLMAEIYA